MSTAGEEGPPVGSAHGLDDDPAAKDFARRVLEAISEWYGEHDFVGNPNVLSWLLGRRPTTLEEYVERLHARVTA